MTAFHIDASTGEYTLTQPISAEQLIQEAKDRGAAVVGIFHDAGVRDAVGTRLFDVTTYKAAA